MALCLLALAPLVMSGCQAADSGTARYSLELKPNQEERGYIAATPIPDSADTYQPGTEVILTAIPYEGYKFSFWLGDVAGSKNPVTLTADNDKAVMAIFDDPQVFSESMVVEKGMVKTRRIYMDKGDEIEGALEVQIPSGDEFNFSIIKPDGEPLVDTSLTHGLWSFRYDTEQSGTYEFKIDNSEADESVMVWLHFVAFYKKGWQIREHQNALLE